MLWQPRMRSARRIGEKAGGGGEERLAAEALGEPRLLHTEPEPDADGED